MIFQETIFDFSTLIAADFQIQKFVLHIGFKYKWKSNSVIAAVCWSFKVTPSWMVIEICKRLTSGNGGISYIQCLKSDNLFGTRSSLYALMPVLTNFVPQIC